MFIYHLRNDHKEKMKKIYFTNFLLNEIYSNFVALQVKQTQTKPFFIGYKLNLILRNTISTDSQTTKSSLNIFKCLYYPAQIQLLLGLYFLEILFPVKLDINRVI